MKHKIPDIVIPSQLDLVPQRMVKLRNGVELHTLSVDCAAVVRLSLVFRGGSSVQRSAFAAASTLSMLSEGSVDFSALQIAERLDSYGIFFDNSTDRDTCFITIASLRKFLPEALELLESIVLRPLFLDDEFTIYRAKKRQQLVIDRDKPSFIAREAFATALFGVEHPYGRFSPVEAYDTLTTDDLRTYYSENLHAGSLFAVASGDIDEVEQGLIEQFLAKIPLRDSAETCSVARAITSGDMAQTIEREGSTQSCIRVGRLLFTKSHPDFVPMQLLLMVLGGYFSSRLVQNLRETNGYTYGAYAGLVTLRSEGYMAIATDVDIVHSDDAIIQIKYELQRLRDELIGEDELMLAKSTITGELMRLIDGPFGIADIAIENIESGKDAGYLNEFLAQILSVTSEQLQQLAVEYLDPESMLIIVLK